MSDRDTAVGEPADGGTVATGRGPVPPTNEGTVELPDGRVLGYATYGPADGTPLLFCHGAPGSRYQRLPDTSVLEAHGIRQISVERPGYGKSTYQPGRTLLDWPWDVAELADSLGLDQFYLVGLSGGGPHALACAVQIPERLLGVAVAGSPGPLGDPAAAATVPLALRYAVKIVTLPGLSRLVTALRARQIRTDPDRFIESMGGRFGEADLAVFRRPAVREMFLEDFSEAVRNGSKGYARDARVGLGDWGFELTDVQTHVDVWHGELDGGVSVELARYVAAELPDSTEHIRPDAGHLLLFDYWDEAVSTLVARRDRTGIPVS